MDEEIKIFFNNTKTFKKKDIDNPHRKRVQAKFVNKHGEKIDPDALLDAINTLRKLGYNEPLVIKGDNLANYFTLVSFKLGNTSCKTNFNLWPISFKGDLKETERAIRQEAQTVYDVQEIEDIAAAAAGMAPVNPEIQGLTAAQKRSLQDEAETTPKKKKARRDLTESFEEVRKCIRQWSI